MLAIDAKVAPVVAEAAKKSQQSTTRPSPIETFETWRRRPYTRHGPVLDLSNLDSRRGALLEKWRALMPQWATFLTTGVIPNECGTTACQSNTP